nr:hypothetical protein [Tanacetum cinerariifolium]
KLSKIFAVVCRITKCTKDSAAPSPSKIAASAEYQAWTTTDIRLTSSISLTPAYLEMDEDMAPDEQEQSSDDEDIGSDHIPTENPIFQPEEVLDIHRTLAEIESLVLYWWGVYKELQEPDLVQGLSLSIQASEN